MIYIISNICSPYNNIKFIYFKHLKTLLLPMYARSKTFVVNVRANTTFVVATSQSQRIALSRGSAAVTYVDNTNGGMA